jgi:asparagine synthase (glutamine-hydrolysing)
MMSAGFDTAAIAGLAGPAVAAQGRKLISLSGLGSQADQAAHAGIRPWLEACRRVMPHLDIRELSGEGENPFPGIERVFSNHDGPGAGDRKISAYLFVEAAAAGARLIMDGYGGDYTLNPRGFGALARLLRRGQFRRFFAELRPHLRETGHSPWQMLKSEIILRQLPQSMIHWQQRIRRKGFHAWLHLALRDIQGPYLQKLRKWIAADAKPGIGSLPITAMRARIRHVANIACRGSAAGGAVPAAAHGLDLTRPFHDKRVVELGLAIPEDYYVRNGLNRHLARLALADVYPPEFQARGHANVGVLLNDGDILRAATPELVAEADRLAKSAKLSAYFDFGEVRRVLLLPAPDEAFPAWVKKSAALRALIAARFIEWFDGSNAK